MRKAHAPSKQFSTNSAMSDRRMVTRSGDTPNKNNNTSSSSSSSLFSYIKNLVYVDTDSNLNPAASDDFAPAASEGRFKQIILV